MLPVEILAVQETVLLRARGSELLILPHHVHHLKTLTKPVEFSAYFKAEALVNRPARKLFEAWLRKDSTVWTRLYRTVHHEIDLSAEGAAQARGETTQPAKAAAGEAEAAPEAATQTAARAPTKAVKAPAKTEAEDDAPKKPVKKKAPAAGEGESPKAAKPAAKAKEAKAENPAAKAPAKAKAAAPAAKAPAKAKAKG